MFDADRPDLRPVVVITGCSSGIGKALCTQFAAHEGGKAFQVVATARDTEALRQLPPQIARVQLDVTNEVSTVEAVAAIINQFGRIDILINNAGINSATGPAAEVSLDRFRSTMEVNYFGLIRVCSHVAKQMIIARSGRIINIGSTVGLVPLPYSAAYCSSKAAVHSYSETLRMELAGFGIQVSIVSPGAIKSSIGETGAKTLVLPKDSMYRSVQDMIICEDRQTDNSNLRAKYSQVSRPAPTPTNDFALMVLHKVALPKYAPVYWIGGSRSRITQIMFYLPCWIRMWFIGKVFQLHRIGK